MKTLSVILTGMIALTTSGLFANNMVTYTGDKAEVKVSMDFSNETRVLITIESLIDKALVLEIYNNDGEQVMNRLVNEHSTQKISHNIGEISEGFYTYMVKDGDQVVYTSRIIKESDGSLEFRSEDSPVNASIEPAGENRVLVRISKDDAAKATIKVWDENGKYLYVRNVKKGHNLRLTHDIAKFPAGKYSFGVFHEGELIALRNITK